MSRSTNGSHLRGWQERPNSKILRIQPRVLHGRSAQTRSMAGASTLCSSDDASMRDPHCKVMLSKRSHCCCSVLQCDTDICQCCAQQCVHCHYIVVHYTSCTRSVVIAQHTQQTHCTTHTADMLCTSTVSVVYLVFVVQCVCCVYGAIVVLNMLCTSTVSGICQCCARQYVHCHAVDVNSMLYTRSCARSSCDSSVPSYFFWCARRIIGCQNSKYTTWRAGCKSFKCGLPGMQGIRIQENISNDLSIHIHQNISKDFNIHLVRTVSKFYVWIAWYVKYRVAKTHGMP